MRHCLCFRSFLLGALPALGLSLRCCAILKIADTLRLFPRLSGFLGICILLVHAVRENDRGLAAIQHRIRKITCRTHLHNIVANLLLRNTGLQCKLRHREKFLICPDQLPVLIVTGNELLLILTASCKECKAGSDSSGKQCKDNRQSNRSPIPGKPEQNCRKQPDCRTGALHNGKHDTGNLLPDSRIAVRLSLKKIISSLRASGCRSLRHRIRKFSCALRDLLPELVRHLRDMLLNGPAQMRIIAGFHRLRNITHDVAAGFEKIIHFHCKSPFMLPLYIVSQL